MKNKSLTPQIRFKGYDDEWQQAKVRDVFTLGNGYTPSKANPAFWTNGTIPWFRMEDIRENGRVLSDSIQHITPEAVKSSGLFPAGSIIVSTTATIGEHALLIADSLANQQFTAFQTVNRWSWLKAKYLLYRFYGLGDWCRKNVNAGGLAAVSITDLQKYDIDFPSTAEERDSIADYFDNIDKLLVDTEREITRLEKMKQASLQKMFPRPGETTPEIRFDGFTGDWKAIRLGDVLMVNRGGSPRPIESFLTNSEKGLNWVKIGDVKKGARYITHTAEKIRPEGVSHTRQVYPGDLILSNSMSFGRPYIMKIYGCIHDGWLLIRDDKKLFDIEFLQQLLGSDNMKRQYKALAAGGVVNNLNSDLVQSALIIYPSIDEQKAIGEYFRNLDAIISAKRQKLEKLQNLKQSCLDKMFVNTTAQ